MQPPPSGVAAPARWKPSWSKACEHPSRRAYDWCGHGDWARNFQNHNPFGRLAMFRNLKAAAFAGLIGAVAMFGVIAPVAAQDKQPIKIGFGIAETGPLGPNGKSALLAMEILVEETNAKGGLLRRPVPLVYFDGQNHPSTVPGIYSKLLDVDKVDVIVGGYGTNMLAPAMPVVVQRKKVFLGLYGLGVNSDFNYDRYFAMIPSGPEP